jgi:hypothetical protein
MSVVPNTGPREVFRERLATYQAGVDRLAAQRARPTPPPERRKPGPGGDWIEISEAEADRRQSAAPWPRRGAESPPAPRWIAAGAVLLSSKALDEQGAPSPGAEVSIPLDRALKQIVTDLVENDQSYRDAIDELCEANERRYNETRALRDENAELKLTVEKLRADMAKLEGRQGVLDHKVERLVVTHTGPPGERGPQGLDGRPGVDGKSGPKGDSALRIVSWEVFPESYEVIPINSNGTKAAPIRLLPLFQKYNSDTLSDEGDDLPLLEPARPG